MDDKIRILIVDDEEVVRHSYRRILSGDGYTVAAASNGEKALKIMEDNPFDVILLDVRMPEMNGLQVLKAIKERWPESEVVIITGYPSIQGAKEAVRLGAFDYLTKPVAPEHVVRTTVCAMTQKKWSLQEYHRGDNDESRGDYRFPWEN
jgi:DNA-binding NtrC family response regulator